MTLHELLRELRPYGFAVWHVMLTGNQIVWYLGRVIFDGAYKFLPNGLLSIDIHGVVTNYKPDRAAAYGDVDLIQTILAKGGTHATADPDASS